MKKQHFSCWRSAGLAKRLVADFETEGVVADLTQNIYRSTEFLTHTGNSALRHDLRCRQSSLKAEDAREDRGHQAPQEIPSSKRSGSGPRHHHSTTPSLFPGLVLSWIDADFRVQIRIFQHFSNSTRKSSSRKQICKIFQNFTECCKKKN